MILGTLRVNSVQWAPLMLLHLTISRCSTGSAFWMSKNFCLFLADLPGLITEQQGLLMTKLRWLLHRVSKVVTVDDLLKLSRPRCCYQSIILRDGWISLAQCLTGFAHTCQKGDFLLVQSTLSHNEYNVPQGCILGPSLFFLVHALSKQHN